VRDACVASSHGDDRTVSPSRWHLDGSRTGQQGIPSSVRGAEAVVRPGSRADHGREPRCWLCVRTTHSTPLHSPTRTTTLPVLSERTARSYAIIESMIRDRIQPIDRIDRIRSSRRQSRIKGGEERRVRSQQQAKIRVVRREQIFACSLLRRHSLLCHSPRAPPSLPRSLPRSHRIAPPSLLNGCQDRNQRLRPHRSLGLPRCAQEPERPGGGVERPLHGCAVHGTLSRSLSISISISLSTCCGHPASPHSPARLSHHSPRVVQVYMLKYDSVHKGLDAEVSAEGGHLVVNGKTINVFTEYVSRCCRRCAATAQLAFHMVLIVTRTRTQARPDQDPVGLGRC